MNKCSYLGDRICDNMIICIVHCTVPTSFWGASAPILVLCLAAS
jgi:hypothetical protein